MKNKIGLTSSALKLIALVSMIVDHIGAFIVKNYVIKAGFFSQTTVDMLNDWKQENAFLYYGYHTMRGVGRLAFPIYCFLLVEGFKYTKNRTKYCLRLLIFAIISEIPFDLAFKGVWWYPSYQNVFFTLLLGFIGMWSMDVIMKKLSNEDLWPYIKICLCIVIVALLMGVGYFLKTDYNMYGVMTIMIMYMLRHSVVSESIMGGLVLCFMSGSEWPVIFAVPLMLLYNGKKGNGPKYLFYLAYPLHIIIIYFVAVYLGLR